MIGTNLVSVHSVEEALRLLAEHTSAKILAGGTDLIVQMREGEVRPTLLVDISRVASLRGIVLEEGRLRIGSMTTFAELARHPLVVAHAPLLAMAASQVGAVQIRNQGTIGGNIANSSPAGDIIPPLLALEARVEIASVRGRRERALDSFFLGVRKNTLTKDELLTEISFALPVAGTRGTFVKLGRRKAMAIARISMAALVTINEEGIIEEARIALGAVGSVVFRATAAEELMRGRLVERSTLVNCRQALVDIVAQKLGSRPSAVYKRQAISGVAEEVFCQLFPEIEHGN